MRRKALVRVPKLLAAILALVVSLAAQPGLTALAADDLPPGRIAFVRKGDIWVWHDGKSERVIKDGAASDPRWSPSGRFLLFVRTGDSYSDLILHDFQDGTETRLTHNGSEAQPGSPDYVASTSWAIDPDWTASGLIAFASDATVDGTVTLWLLADPGGSPQPAAAAQGEDNIEGISLAADGSVAAYTVRAHDKSGRIHAYVALRDLSNGVSKVLVDKPGGAFDPAIAPDGQSIALSIRAADGTSDVWLADRSGNLTRVTTGAQAIKSAWSPDGTWLAYVRMIDFRFEIWAQPRTGTSFGEPRRLFRYQNFDATSRISWTLTSP